MDADMPPPPPSQEETAEEAQRRQQDELDWQEEIEHFTRVVHSFLEYGPIAAHEADRVWNHAKKLPQHQLDLLPANLLEERCEELRNGAAGNDVFFSHVLQHQNGFGPLDTRALVDMYVNAPEQRRRVRPGDLSKLKSTLQSLVRDWSDEGAAERERCYAPMIDALRARVPVPPPPAPRPRVLVPGSGLGRLVLEVAGAGYAAQGNEFSYQVGERVSITMAREPILKGWERVRATMA